MDKITPGSNPPEKINVVIEIPEGSRIKYELDKKTNMLFVDRFAFTTMGYPANYGFIPNTSAEDGDPIDVLVLASQSVHPGTVIECRPVGMLEMEDEEGIDTKIIAVPVEKVDPFMSDIKDIDDVTDSIKNKIRHFFEHYKELEPGKWVKLKEWRDKQEAESAIRESVK